MPGPLRIIASGTSRRLFIPLIGLLTFAQIIGLVLPYLPGLAIDRAVIPGDTTLLWLIAAGGVAVHGLTSLTSYFARIRLVRFAEALWNTQRSEAFNHLQGLSLAYHRRQAAGDLLSRIHYDTWTIKGFLEGSLPGLVHLVVTVGGTGTILLIIAPSLALLVLIPLPLALAIAWLFRHRVRPLSRAALDERAAIYTTLIEGIEGIEHTKIYGGEGVISERVHEAGRRVREKNVALARHSAILFPLLDVSVALVLLGSLAVGGGMVIEGTLTLGTLVTFYFYIGRVVGPVRASASIALSWQDAAAASERLAELYSEQDRLEDPVEPVDVPTENGWRLRLQDVRFSYTDPKRNDVINALDNVSFELAPGDSIAILGPSGSGKSTTGRLVPRLFDPATGTITVNDVPLSSIRKSTLRRHVGYVGQDVFLFAGTIAENVQFAAPDVSPAAVEQAMADAGVDLIAAYKPDGVHTVIGEKGARLSGGERKRIALARALLHRPRILVIDQLASDLEVALCQRIFHRLRADSTLAILYLGHQIPAGLAPSRVYWMEHGRLGPLPATISATPCDPLHEYPPSE